jgi:hypothetical protein
MPGFSQTTLNYKARNANQVAVLVGDQVMAFAQTASHQFSFGTEGLYGVGNALPQEIQQLRISPSITLSAFALTQAGMTALAGGNNIAYLLGNNQFDLHVVDGQTNQPIFTYVGCVAQSYAETIAANQPVTQDIPFLAMDVLDANGNSVLNSNSAITVSTAAASAAGAIGGV